MHNACSTTALTAHPSQQSKHEKIEGFAKTTDRRGHSQNEPVNY